MTTNQFDTYYPDTWSGTPEHFPYHDIYPWVNGLPQSKKIYCHFFSQWEVHPIGYRLPEGYDYYIISYHEESVDLDWLQRQRRHCDGRFIVLLDGYGYDLSTIDDCCFVSYPDYDYRIEKNLQWWKSSDPTADKKYKFSCALYRPTQSKIWITTKLLELNDPNNLIIKNTFKNPRLDDVHHWEMTGNTVLDRLTLTYLSRYQNISLNVDNQVDPKHNWPRFNSNPWQPLYKDTCLHFVNGSFHYSFMMENSKTYIYPGPDVDEKIIKCLISGTPFIPCGQFQVYKRFEELGLRFDYDFDTSWDNESGNLTRFEKICELIDYLAPYDKDDLLTMLGDSAGYNREQIMSGKFKQNCMSQKALAIEKIFSLLAH